MKLSVEPAMNNISSIITGLFLLCVLPGMAQKNRPVQFGVEAGTSLSFTGLNVSLAANAEWGPHEFFAGPKWVASDTYLVGRGPWGIEAGYRWNGLRGKKMLAFASVNYQAAFLSTGDPERKVRVQEGHLAYGFQWKLARHLRIGNAIGLGGVIERSRVNGRSQGDPLTGFSLLFKLFASYHFPTKAPADATQ